MKLLPILFPLFLLLRDKSHSLGGLMFKTIDFGRIGKNGNLCDIPGSKKDKIEKDSLNLYDVYQFVDDTLNQRVYIYYITPRQIKFLARTNNKITHHKCEYYGTAFMSNGEGTGQGSDELNNDELYGVYEYFTDKHPFITIDVEFKRGKRLTIFTKDIKDLCTSDCPMSSKGILRRISLSKEVQHNPKW